jgi:hypothetical protein
MGCDLYLGSLAWFGHLLGILEFEELHEELVLLGRREGWCLHQPVCLSRAGLIFAGFLTLHDT